MTVLSFVIYLLLFLAACSALYHLAVALAALLFRSRQRSTSNWTPPVSILKPLRGIEENFYSNLATFLRQDYPNFEIVFGLSDSNDAARWTIAQLQRNFPRIPVKVVTVSDPSGTNPKMGKLQQMLDQSSHEIVALSDADIRVEPDYLRRVVRPLSDEGVGLVTCLYRGIPARSLLSLFEALGMSGDFAGQVLLARILQGIRFGLGASMVTRKKQIAQIGGIARWADYLADDYILGREIAAAGFRIHLSDSVVETVLPHRKASQMFHQQLRWARTIRACSPSGYPGLIFVFGVPLAFAGWALAPHSPVALGTLAAVLLARLLSAFAAGRLVCRDPLLVRYFWLLPVRDLWALGIWFLSFFGREVVWRDARFRLEPGGKIRPA